MDITNAIPESARLILVRIGVDVDSLKDATLLANRMTTITNLPVLIVGDNSLRIEYLDDTDLAKLGLKRIEEDD